MSSYAYDQVKQAGDETMYGGEHGFHASPPAQHGQLPVEAPSYEYEPSQLYQQPYTSPPPAQQGALYSATPPISHPQEQAVMSSPYSNGPPIPAAPTAAATYDPPYATSFSNMPSELGSPSYSPEGKMDSLPSDDHTVIDIPQYRVPGWGYADGMDTEYYDEKGDQYGISDDESQDGGLELEEDEEGNTSTQHFGPAPAKGAQLRRHKSKKHVSLVQGNLILDCPVPTKLLGFLNNRTDSEFTTMRYTAVTCDPDDFLSHNYTLRPRLYGRQTELFICMTMYNEDEVLFARTLHGVMKNIAHLCSRTRSKTWGAHGWQKVVVAIVSDGRKKIHPRVLDCLAALGVYQDGVAKNTVNDEVVQAHVYEYTTQLSLDPNMRFKGAEKGLMPCQIIFCLKERNQKKINSHRWFFNAFSRVLKPNICLLLDVGTRPEPKSVYHLWKSFDINSNVAGACGEICADTKGKWGIGPALLNPLVAAQNFEYKISNILDKTTESVFGFISVLPGAFSAYRYIALQNDEDGKGPLASYFKGETLLGADADVFTSNMYLAEDRILCFELAAKRNAGWVLKYVKSARGVTDVPTDLAELISQRRRWLNGSFFAGLYSLVHSRQLARSGHTPFRKTMLGIQAVYNLLTLVFSWFTVGNMFIFFSILTQGLEAPDFHLSHINVLNTIAQYVYIGTLVGCFIFALGNRPQGSRWKYYTASGIFAVLMVYMFVAAIVCFVHAIKHAHGGMYMEMILSLIATWGVYVVSSIIALDPSYLLTSMMQYMLLSPTWANVLNVYAFCNLHDFSWGTKGDHTVSNDLGRAVVAGKGEKEVVELVLPNGQADIDAAYDEALLKLRTRPAITESPPSAQDKDLERMDYYRNVRTNVVLAWVLSNILLMAIILGAGGQGSAFDSSGSTRQKVYMVIILIWVAASASVRFLCSTVYMTIRLLGG